MNETETNVTNEIEHVGMKECLDQNESTLKNTLLKTTSELKCEKKRTTISQRSSINKLELNYNNYFKFNIELKSYKLPQLKDAAKKYKVPVSGAKIILIERLTNIFKKIRQSIIVQRIFRGWIVRNSIYIRGNALKNRSICVNDTDFVTMEPLSEIPNEYFCSYTDSKDFTYGFNITSLIQILKIKGNIINPYNREKFDDRFVSNFITLYKITFIIYPEFKNENQEYNTNARQVINIYRPPISAMPSSILTNHYRPTLNHAYAMNMESQNRLNRIQNIQSNPVNQRINDLFIEIDMLGNYTQSVWFSNLDIRGFLRLYRSLYDIWHYRSQLSREVRNKICPFYGPFDGIFSRPIQHHELNLEQIKLACLIVIENMVYCGVDDDHRKLGALHSLSGLTIVSAGARTSMPWLYDSVAM